MACIQLRASEHDDHKLYDKLASDARANPGLQ